MPYHSLPNEPELLRQVAEGDHTAYKTLYDFYPPKCRRSLRMTTELSYEDIDDLLQHVFLKIWEDRDSMASVQCFRGYLNRMIKNKYLMQLRHRDVKVSVHKTLQKETEPVPYSAEDDQRYEIYQQKVFEAIDLIPEIRRSIVRLRWLEGHSRAQTAKKFSISEVAVKKQLFKGKVFIISYLRKHGGESILLIILFF